jgi:hypothetical protein
MNYNSKRQVLACELGDLYQEGRNLFMPIHEGMHPDDAEDDRGFDLQVLEAQIMVVELKLLIIDEGETPLRLRTLLMAEEELADLNLQYSEMMNAWYDQPGNI